MRSDVGEEAADFVERELAVAVGVCSSEHVFRLLISERFAEVFHGLLDFLRRDEPVRVAVERPECFVEVGVVRVLTEVLHDAAEVVEVDAISRAKQFSQSVFVDGQLQLLARRPKLNSREGKRRFEANATTTTSYFADTDTAVFVLIEQLKRIE